MEFIPTPIVGAYEVRLNVHSDERGHLKRQYCQREFASAGLDGDYVQVNHSITVGRGVLRGLHYQRPPVAEHKLVSCLLGRVYDIAVDLRHSSPSLLRWVAVELDGSNAFYIPRGCAHGFQTLTDEAHLLYMHSEFYTPSAEGGIRFDDPAIGVEWPLPPTGVSARDRSFRNLTKSFEGIAV